MFREKPLNQYSESQLISIIKEANDAYFNEQPFLTDEEYDTIKDYMQDHYPNNPILKEVGAPVKKNKVNLPYEMWSMNKIKLGTPTCVSSLNAWLSKYKGPYLISAKLDGISGFYYTQENKKLLTTRGDAKTGQNINHFWNYLPNLPKKCKNVGVRGEFIMAKQTFSSKYKDQFSNARNLVGGTILSQSVSPILKDIQFIAHEMKYPMLKPSEQFKRIEELGFQCVLYTIINEINVDILTYYLTLWRETYPYQIDGIICRDDNIHPSKSSNPDDAFAFKMDNEGIEAKVVDVIWTPSKDGYLKPRVRIEPIMVDGVCIEYATGVNGLFIYKNNIGIGSTVEIVRSGDVIPNIRRILKPSLSPKMPSCAYKWTDSKVDILLDEEEMEQNTIVREKNITFFFKGIGVEGLSSGNILRLMNAGFDTIEAILRMSLQDFMKVDGFQEKMAKKLYEGIRDKVNNASLLTIMSSSNLLGRGINEKKIEVILNSYPDILTSRESLAQKCARLEGVKGIGPQTANAFVSHIGDFMAFLKSAQLEAKLNAMPTAPVAEGQLCGKTIVLSGFRDAELLACVGAKMGSSVSKNTFMVVVPDKDSRSGKIDDAIRLGIPIITLDEFKKTYNC